MGFFFNIALIEVCDWLSPDTVLTNEVTDENAGEDAGDLYLQVEVKMPKYVSGNFMPVTIYGDDDKNLGEDSEADDDEGEDEEEDDYEEEDDDEDD